MAWHPFRNIGWKFLALLMGTALWFTVSGDLAIERAVDDRPVIMKNTATGVQAIVIPSRVTVTVRGSREELGTLQDNQVTVLVDLAGLARVASDDDRDWMRIAMRALVRRRKSPDERGA